MFVIVRTERPRDEVAPFILSKISAAKRRRWRILQLYGIDYIL